MTIAYREARETKYWLKLLKKTDIINNDFNFLLENIEELVKIIGSIIKTSKKNN
jgi:four helix bundle protein